MTRPLSAAALAAALLAVPPAFAQGRITLISYAGIFQDTYSRVVVQPFAQATRTEVTYFPGGSSAQMLGTLRAQRAEPQTDVVIMDTTTAAIACAEGLVEPLTEAELPVLARISPLARQSGGRCGPGVTFDHLVLVYDTQAVPQPPTGFAVLWDPAHRGRVSLYSPPNIQGLSLTAILAHAETGDWRNANGAFARLRALAPAVQTFDPNPDGYTLILNNVVRFSTGWNARSQLYRDQSNGRLGVVLPAEGTVFQINTINVVRGSRNRAAAMAFAAHALAAGTQAEFTNAMFYAPTNLDAQPAEAALARTAAAPQFRERVIPLDWEEMLRLRDQWNQRWRREVIAAGTR
jgi:putative spermidine/putrescine transport system substrate-binding protein